MGHFVGLDDNALSAILCYLDTPHDLLRLGRTCQRLHHAVQHCAAAWQQLFWSLYPGVPVSTHGHVCYRQLVQERWIKDAKEQRLQRKVQRMRLQSDAVQLQRELHHLHEQMRAERKLQQSIEQQLRELHRTRLARNASQAGQWQLGAVQLYHNKVVQAAPVRPEAKMADLQQQQKVSRLQLQTFRASIHLREQRLADTRRRLAAHEG